jgi:hypothetical protein
MTNSGILFNTNCSDISSSSVKKAVPQQIENLSPLAVGDQKLDRHLGYFSGTLMNGIYPYLTQILPKLTLHNSRPDYWYWYFF